ncbi:CHAT domain-containing protein [Streptomyces sp. NPDC048650]|uniref:CHAT domain-containing protein n=1 Tax=Streptomyces sp. NPDC048650 TaxID=3365583 RepID=UPI00372311D4
MSEAHLAAVRLRLRRIDESGDTGPALEQGALAEAERLAQTLGVEGDLAARAALGRLYWIRSRALPGEEGSRERQQAVDILRPCFLAGTAGLPAPLLPELADATAAEAARVLQQAMAGTDPAALTRSAELWQRILDATPKDHRHRVRYLARPATALLGRFRCTGATADLDGAIASLRAAVDAAAADHPERKTHLTSLRAALMTRYERLGDGADLDEAIALGRSAVATADPGDPARYAGLVEVCTLLQVRFARSHRTADLDEAIAAGSEVVERAPAGFAERPVAVSNVAVALQTRAQRTGAGADLDRAVDLLRSAVNDFPAPDPSRLSALANLGSALRNRYQLAGRFADLDAAVAAGQEVLTATPAHHPQRAARLSNLGLALLLRFDARANAADLYTAIDLTRSALAVMPAGDPVRPGVLNHLGLGLWSRFLRTHDTTDLAAAAREFRAAAEATSGADPARTQYLANLGNALRLRFATTGDRSDQDEAIAALRAAVAAAPDGLPDTAAFAAHLGDALDDRYRRTRDPVDRDAAVAAYTKAADGPATPPSVRAAAAYRAGRLLAADAPGRAADLLETAVRALPGMTPRRPEPGAGQQTADPFAGLCADAAALALSDPRGTPGERAARALRLLEAGRAELLGRAPDTRDGLTELRLAHPETAARFTALRDRLDRPAGDGRGRGLPSVELELTAATGRPPLPERDRTAAEFAQALAAVRALDGFESFGRPPTAAELLGEAAHGPVVVFNISPRRSDALLLTGDGIRSVPLPGLRHDALTRTVAAFHQELRVASAHRHRRRRRAAQLALTDMLGWLWDAAAEPVLRELGYHDPLPPGAPWPRVWWAPGGLLGLLPLHAAGHHTDPPDAPDRRTVLDRVVSSYTPTVRALHRARRHAPESAAAPPRALVVAMPTTPGLPGDGRLEHVAAEVGVLRDRLDDPLVLWGSDGRRGSGPGGPVPTQAQVLERLSACPVAHFACHTESHPTDPSQSRILLHDHESDPLTVAGLASAGLDGAQLAYLSACHPAVTPTAAPADEAIHPTAALQLAGFPHVVGTLWAIDDKLSVTVADTFYARLRTDDRTLDTRRSALALHHTVRTLRERFPRAPSLWAAYLHAGA